MPVQHHPECLVRVTAGGLVDQLAEAAVYQRSIIIRSSRAPRACPHLCPPDSLTPPTHPSRPTRNDTCAAPQFPSSHAPRCSSMAASPRRLGQPVRRSAGGRERWSTRSRPDPGGRTAGADRRDRWRPRVHLRRRDRGGSAGRRERGHRGRAELQPPQVRRERPPRVDQRTGRRGAWRIRGASAAARLSGGGDHGVRLASGPDHPAGSGRGSDGHAGAHR